MSKKKNEFLDMIKEYFPEEMTSGQLIKAKRLNYNITLEEIEEVTGISQSNLSMYENDKKNIGLVQATKIGLVIGLHPMTILFPNGYHQSERFRDIAAKGKKLLSRKVPTGAKTA